MEALRQMRKFHGPFLAVDLRDIYTEKGSYEFKIALDPKKFSDAKSTSIVIRDVDGRDVPVKRRDWGTKICLTMTIDETVADGLVALHLENELGRERYTFWVIK
jgi:hypothetical protein